MEKKLKITTAKQFQILISELEKNPILAKGFHRATTPSNFKQDWEEVAIKLNSVGPPERDSDGWQKVWRDFKFKTKKKMLKVAEMNESGGGGNKPLILHPLEEAAANIIQVRTQLSTGVVFDAQPEIIEIKTENLEEMKTEMLEQTFWGEEEDLASGNQSAAEEIKTENYCMMDQTFMGDEAELPSTSVHSIRMEKLQDRRKRKRNRKNDERQALLEKHNTMQEKVFNKISNTVLELKNILEESGRLQQILLEVEEKKLKIMQQRNQREEQLFESEMKLKMLEMKIKTKELDAFEKRV